MYGYFFNKPIRYFKKYYSFAGKREYYSQYIETNPAALYEVAVKPYKVSKAVCQRVQVKNLSFGFSPSQVWLKWGLPRCSFHKWIGDSRLQIFLYKNDFGSIQSYISCHFLNGRLVLVQICFPHTCQHTRGKVLDMLKRKYHFALDRNVEEFLIHHNKKEQLIVQNDCYLNLFYFSGDRSFVHAVGEALEKKKQLRNEFRNEQFHRLEELL